MGIRAIKDLPTAQEVASRYPVTEEHRIPERRQAVKDVIAGSDRRLLIVTGPCSAWPSDAVKQYADRLARVSEALRERLLIVLRTYIQKPRTTIGWPGPLNQPDPLSPVDIEKGIYECRELMVAVGRLHPLADEMLFTHNAPHFSPLLSYQALGARSAEDMEHRYIASGFDCAVGVKNGTSGDLQVGVNGVVSVQAAHTFALHNQQVKTDGNPHAHLVLRGGAGKVNYDATSIRYAATLLTEANIKNPALVIDASHENSLHENGVGNVKDPHRQVEVFRSVMQGMMEGQEGYNLVRGLMMESFLQTGNQKITQGMDREGLSITDPCLGWNETEKLLRDIAETFDRAPST